MTVSDSEGMGVVLSVAATVDAPCELCVAGVDESAVLCAAAEEAKRLSLLRTAELTEADWPV